MVYDNIYHLNWLKVHPVGYVSMGFAGLSQPEESWSKQYRMDATEAQPQTQ
jgi:hypothetical protein